MAVPVIEVNERKFAVIPMEAYEAMRAAAKSILDYHDGESDEGTAKGDENELPAEAIARIRAGESPLKVWREHRGLTMEKLGQLVGRQSSMISKLEKGRNEGGIKLWKAIADALAVRLDHLVPV